MRMKDGLAYDLPVVKKLTNPMNNLLERFNRIASPGHA